MNGGILVSRESDVAQLPRPLRVIEHLLRTLLLVEDAVRVLVPDDLVMLHEVDAVGLEPPERLVELPFGGARRAAVDLRHEERALPVACAQRLAHAPLARAVIVVPGVVHERDAGIDGCTDDPGGQPCVAFLGSEVGTADTDAGDPLAGST